jgi:hypothetical protein
MSWEKELGDNKKKLNPKYVYPPKSLNFIFSFLILAVILYLFLAYIPSKRSGEIQEKEFLHYSFEDFNGMIGSDDQLALGQALELFNQYKGKYVRWTGEVIKIEKESEGGYTLFIKHLPSPAPYDVKLFLEHSKKDEIRKRKKGDIITYTGRLESYDPVSGYVFEDGDIE